MDNNSIDEKKINLEFLNSNYSNLAEKQDDEKLSKNKYPKTVFLIILNEFCERFSYYGIRTVLFLYLTNFIKIEQHSATAIYHAFTVICYFTPVLGAILADGYLGLYKTILYVSIVYSIGEIILTLTSAIPLGAPNIVGPSIALFIIAIGTGGNQINIIGILKLLNIKILIIIKKAFLLTLKILNSKFKLNLKKKLQL